MALSQYTNAFKIAKTNLDVSHRFETSWLLNPWLLFACRALISTYAFVTLFFNLGWNCSHPSLGGCQTSRRSFSYFTVLTYWGLAFYFAVAAVHTLTYCLSGGRAALLDRFPAPLRALHSLYYTSVITLPFLVTIVYWGVLYSAPWFPVRFEAWSNISQHGLNSAFALFELILPRTSQPPWVHLLWLIVILLAYLALAFVTLADQGWYTYSFLDHDEVGGRAYVAAYVFGIAVAIVIIFVLVSALVVLRVWITETKLGCHGKFAKSNVDHDRASDAEMGELSAADRSSGSQEAQKPATP